MGHDCSGQCLCTFSIHSTNAGYDRDELRQRHRIYKRRRFRTMYFFMLLMILILMWQQELLTLLRIRRQRLGLESRSESETW